MRLRSNLLLLVAGTMLPVLALTATLSYLLVEHEKEIFRRAAMDRNRTFMTAVDSELRGHILTLEALATSGHLTLRDYRSFYEESARILRSQPDWRNVLLFAPDTRQLVNVRAGLDRPLPRTIEVDTVRRAVATQRPVIGDVSQGPLGDADFALPIRIPVVRDGDVAFVLSAIIRLDRFAAIMREQRFPEGWAIGLVDANGLFIARIPAKPAGQSASSDLRAAIRSAGEGWFRGRTLEGTDTYTAYLTSGLTRWTVAVAVPASQVSAVAHRVAWAAGVGTLACVVLALGFAFWMGRRIAGPIAALASAAQVLGKAPAPAIPDGGGVDEVREVAQALSAAAKAIKEREALLESEQVALKAADRAKDEFLAMLGHELRNPLSAITSAAYLLRIAKPAEDAAVHAHGVMERQTRHMTRLIEDLLDVSRLAMGKVTLRREDLELSDFAARVARTWEQAHRRAAAVRVASSPVWVRADRARLEQIICNLLDNAEKFSPAGASIELRVREEDGAAVLEVEDYGEGIPREMLGRIFELFVQGPQSSDRARGGMGLGLTLVKRLVQLHEGSVAAESDGPGKGARFTVRLAAVVPGEHRAAPTGRGEVRAESRRILVVEDNEDGRRTLEAILAVEGHFVRGASSGGDALALAHAWLPEIAIIDIGLPDVDGYEVARRLRASEALRRITLVALTGYGQEQDQRRAYEAGFDLHLTKPVEPEFLRDALSVLGARERAITAC